MKRFLVVAAILSIGSFAEAITGNVWLSSNTATADTTQVLCGQYAVNGTTSTLHASIDKVIVSSAIAATTLTLYNSTFTATGVQSIGPISTAGVATFAYDSVVFPSGLIYTKTGTAQVQILYQCY